MNTGTQAAETNEDRGRIMERLLIGIEDAAETLGVGRSTAYSLINTGDLETVKIGRRSLITAASVRDYVERLTSTDTRPAA